jgi:hypothetical protein
MNRILIGIVFFGYFQVSVLAQGQHVKDKGPAAEKLLADGLAKAKKENKAVFLDFSSPT